MQLQRGNKMRKREKAAILLARAKGIYFRGEMAFRHDPRDFLAKGFFAAIMLLYIPFALGIVVNATSLSQGDTHLHTLPEERTTPEYISAPPQSQAEETEVGPNLTGPVVVNLEKMTGRMLASLNADYLGFAGQVPAARPIDFEQNLEAMWHKKTQIQNVSEATLTNAERITTRYRASSKTKMPLGTFVSQVESTARSVEKNLDWANYCQARKLTAVKCHSLQSLAGGISSRHLVAYLMTELFPNRVDGAFNATLLDTLLQNAGREYIDSIPALGDTLASLGGWQFTSYAVREDTQSTEGASVVNQFLPKELQIPGSVVYLVRSDHEKAAYLFAIYNLTSLLRELSDEQAQKLQHIGKKSPDTVATFMAVAHHQPLYAVRGFQKWVSRPNKSPKVFLSARLKIYAEKAENNLSGIDTYLGQKRT
ncbi:MAG: hypothetical protein RI996_149 [Candidatus Parcubacteria bacterium]|jgi:hypothetical protein